MNNRFIIFLVAGIVFICLSLTLIALLSLDILSSLPHLTLGFIVLFISAGLICLIEASQSRIEVLSEKIYAKLDEIVMTMTTTFDSVTFFTQPRGQVGKEKYISDLLEIRRYYENASEGTARAKIVSTDFDEHVSVVVLEGKADSRIKSHTHKYEEYGMLLYGEALLHNGEDKDKLLTPGEKFHIAPYQERGISFKKNSAIVIRLVPPFDYGSSEFNLTQ